MSLKILLFPVCIILSLTLIIGFIKPDVVDILAKRKTITAKQTDLARVGQTIQSVKRMTVEIDGRQEGEKFVLKYLPISLEEERVLDTFNYLAAQSGVVIVEASAEENPPVETPIPEDLHASMSFQALADAQVVDPSVPPVPKTRTIHSYTGTVSVMGAYSNLKDFFQRLSQSDRYRTTIAFSIEKPDEKDIQGDADDKQSAYPADFLKGTYEAEFAHFPIREMGSALDIPLFQKERFDFGTVDDLINFVSNPLPAMEVNLSPKSNPFQ